MSQYQRVGDWLVAQGVLTDEQRDSALVKQKESKSRFGEVVVQLGYATENQISQCLAQQYDLPLAKLKSIKPNPDALKLVSPTFALSRLMLPFQVNEFEFHCVISDPLDIQATDYLTRALGKRLVLSVAPGSELLAAITKAYEIPAAKCAPITKAKEALKQETKRKVRIDDLSDRKTLLTAMAGSGTDPLWDTYGD